jgi:hypothetical protein
MQKLMNIPRQFCEVLFQETQGGNHFYVTNPRIFCPPCLAQVDQEVRCAIEKTALRPDEEHG